MSGSIAVAARVMIAVVFAVAVIGKLRSADSFTAFRATLDRVSWLPARLHTLVAALVVAVEAITAVTVLVPAVSEAGLLLAITVLAGFTTTAALAMRNGKRLQCRCFGSDGGEMGAGQIARNGLLLATAAIGLALAAPATIVLDVSTMVAVLSGLTLAVVMSRWNDLLYIFRL